MKKKIVYGICMMALVALVATSCKKKEEKVSFSAEIGLLQADDAERAYINPVNFATYWQGNEQIKMYNINESDWTKSVTQIYQINDAGSSFSTTSGSGIGYNTRYYAFCPASMAADDLLEGNYQRFEILDNQPLFANPAEPGMYMVTVSGTSLPMAGTCTYDNPVVNFQHIFGIVGFRFICDPEIVNNVPKYRRLNSMTITDPNMNLSGYVTLKPHKIKSNYLDEIMTAYKTSNLDFDQIGRYQSYVLSHEGEGLGYSAEGGGHTISYDLEEAGGLQWNPNTPYVTVYVAMRPGALGNGFTVSLDVFQEGKGIRTVDIDFPADRTKVMEPNRIKPYTVDITNDVNAAFAEN